MRGGTNLRARVPTGPANVAGPAFFVPQACRAARAVDLRDFRHLYIGRGEFGRGVRWSHGQCWWRTWLMA
jgi:hypothetical protein